MVVRSAIHRLPSSALGEVLVLGTWNYPLLLPGVQVAQALAAGNRVQLKPAVGTESVSEIMCQCFVQAGVPETQLELLDSSTEAAQRSIERGVDLIVLTGAAETGRKVLKTAAGQLSAAIMELSGCDAAIVLPGHDPDRLVQSMRFGLRFNASATCIGPRRLVVRRSEYGAVSKKLSQALKEEPEVAVHSAARSFVADKISEALDQGAVDVLGHFDEQRLRTAGRMRPVLLDRVTASHEIASSDVFAPVLSMMTVDDDDQAVRIVNECPYRLAASVFGPAAQANRVAARLQVGTVTINDVITSTADPRLPFGGRGQSGFGVTRGPEGLLAMTAAKVVSTRTGLIAPHLRQRSASDEAILHGVLQMVHGGGLRKRLAGLRHIVGGVKKG